MNNFKSEYDKSRLENQMLRDKLIQTMRELDGVKKQRHTQLSSIIQEKPSLADFCVTLHHRNVSLGLWLLFVDIKKRKLIKQLREGDFIISSKSEMYGNMIENIPICSSECLSDMNRNVFILIQGDEYQYAKEKLLNYSYKECIDFMSLDEFI